MQQPVALQLGDVGPQNLRHRPAHVSLVARMVSAARRVPLGLRGVALLLLAILFGSAALVGTAVWRELDAAQDLRERLDASFETRSQIQHMAMLLQDVQRAQRGYLTTGKGRFLQPYFEAAKQLPEQIRIVERLVARQSEEAADFGQLKSLAQDLLDYASQSISVYSYPGPAAAAEFVSTGRGEELIDGIREVAGRMIERERDRVEDQVAAYSARTSRTRQMILFVLAGSAAILGAAIVLAFVHIGRRARAEAALRRQERLVEMLRRVTAASNEASCLPDALRGVLRAVAEGSGAERAQAAAADPSTGTLRPVDSLPPDGSRCGEPGLLAGSEPGEAATIPRFIEVADAGKPGAVREDLIVPILDRDEAVAMLAWSWPNRPPEKDMLLAAARYLQSQLSRAAERDRILSSLHDAVVRHRAVFESAMDGIVTLDESGGIESFNPAAERLFGTRADAVLGRPFRLVEDPARGDALERLRGVANSGGGLLELVGRRGDGSTFPIDVAVSAMQLDGRRSIVALLRDISERKRVEEMKSEFVATVSHELRTPLTSIAGSLGLLAGGAAGPLPEPAAKLVRIAHGNGQRLVRLVNDILDLARIEAGRIALALEPRRIRPLVEDAIEANRGFSERFGVSLELDRTSADGVALVDADRLSQVLTNLLSNAVKFSPKEAPVTVAVREHDSRLRISVRDRGPGIPEHFRPHVFSRFAQADASDSRQRGGTGLGLSIAKQIVTSLGGAISFETAPGWGTEFHVDLPKHP